MDRLRFDTVKLVTSSEHLSSINSTLFRHNIDLQLTPKILDRLNQCTGVDHHLQQRRGDWIIQKQGIPR